MDMETQDMLLGDESWYFVMGVLEYDSQSYGKMDTNHRDYLKRKSRLLKCPGIDNEIIKKTIRITYRLSYIKNVVLAQTLDENMLNFRISALIFKNYDNIFNYVLTNRNVLKSVTLLVRDSDPKGLKFLLEVNSIFSQNPLLDNYKDKIWAVLESLGVFEGLIGIIRKIAAPKEVKTPKKNKALEMLQGYGVDNRITQTKKIEPYCLEVLCLEVLIGSLRMCPFLLRAILVSTREKTLQYPSLRSLLDRMDSVTDDYLIDLYNETMLLLVLDYDERIGPGVEDKSHIKEGQGRFEIRRALQETMLKVFTKRLLKNITEGASKASSSLRILKGLCEAHPDEFAVQIEESNFLEYAISVLNYKEKKLILMSIQLLISLIDRFSSLIQEKIKPYLRRLYKFFLVLKKEGLLYNTFLHFSDEICRNGSEKIIVYIMEDLKDLATNPRFIRTHKKMMRYYELMKQGKASQDIIDELYPRLTPIISIKILKGEKKVVVDPEIDITGFVNTNPEDYSGLKPSERLLESVHDSVEKKLKITSN